MWFRIVLALAKLSAFAIKLIDEKRGTDFPGKLASKLSKDFGRGFSGIDYDRVLFVTGSNGKSTTTNLIYHILEESGKPVASNLKGSNMLNGALTVLIKNSTLSGRVTKENLIIEVDERSFPDVYQAIPARRVLVTNVMQDQVHRNGEPDLIYQLFYKSFNREMKLYLNNDEPRSKSYEDLAGSTVYYGAGRNDASYEKNGVLDVSMPCPKCHHKIEFEYLNVSNIGRFHCSHCGFGSGDDAVEATDVDFDAGTLTIAGHACKMPYTAPVMLYNYAAAAAAALDFGVSGEAVASAISSFVNVAGRMETIPYKGKRMHYIRMKQENPETLQGALDAIARDPSPKVFVIGLCTLEERRPQWVPHYTNTYYAYECDFKPLLASNIEKVVCFSKTVCYDVANRLAYDGVEPEDMVVLDSDGPDDVLAAIDKTQAEDIYIITLMRLMEGFKKRIGQIGEA